MLKDMLRMSHIRTDEGRLGRCLPTPAAVCVLALVVAAGLPQALGADWPAYQHDNRRSGITAESLKPPLSKAWVYSSPQPPQPAWPGHAKWDAYAEIKDIESMRNFDPVFFVTVVGDRVTFGSSADDAAHCLDAKTGQEQWTCFTDGAVRLPPAHHDGKVYFGSDDGNVYCLDTAGGKVAWKYRPSTDPRCVLNNGKLVSQWPIRTGVTVQDGKVYFGASLLPWSVSYLCAIDAGTGGDKGDGLYKRVHPEVVTQGVMLASDNSLYVSQGRSTPLKFNRATGELIGSFGKSGNGGVFGVLAPDDVFIHGLGQNHGSFGELRSFDTANRDQIATFPSATCMVLTDRIAYLQSRTDFAAFERVRYLDIERRRTALMNRREELDKQIKDLLKSGKAAEVRNPAEELKETNLQISKLSRELGTCYLWKQPAKHPHAIILAGQTLYCGGTGEVAAFDAKDGKALWQAPVDGKAHGLAVANGRLFVSTDRGSIYCFAATAP